MGLNDLDILMYTFLSKSTYPQYTVGVYTPEANYMGIYIGN